MADLKPQHEQLIQQSHEIQQCENGDMMEWGEHGETQGWGGGLEGLGMQGCAQGWGCGWRRDTQGMEEV